MENRKNMEVQKEKYGMQGVPKKQNR